VKGSLRWAISLILCGLPLFSVAYSDEPACRSPEGAHPQDFVRWAASVDTIHDAFLRQTGSEDLQSALGPLFDQETCFKGLSAAQARGRLADLEGTLKSAMAQAQRCDKVTGFKPPRM
jgi:hypothetical protein